MSSEISLSASKAMTIFTEMCERGEPCTLAELVRATGYPRTVTNRMVATLVHHGFIDRHDESGLYSVSPLSLHMVNKAFRSDPLLTRVEQMMRQIVNRTADNALFMIRNDRHAYVIRRAEGASPIKVYGSQVGMSLPLHCGGAPMVLLAHCEPAFIDDYLSGPLEARTEHTCTDAGKIRERLIRIREDGYAFSREDLFEYVVAIGAPVFDDRNRLAGAISVGNITQRYPPERMEDVRQILIEEIARY